MIKWLRKVPPTVGTVWELRSEKTNPFTDKYKVRVMEIKSGWVKYDWLWDNTGDYSNYLNIRDFRICYKETN